MKGYYRLATAQLEQEEYDLATSTIKQGLALDANNTQLLKVLRNIKQAKKMKASASVSTAATSGIANGGGAMSNLPHGNKLDTATSRELYDLQVQYNQTSKEYNTVQANLTKIQREYKMQEITHKQLSGDIPANTSKSYYRTVGKVFMKSTHTNILDHLTTSMEDRSKKEIDLKSKLDYLDRRLKSTKTNMDELIGTVSTTTAETKS